MLTDDPKKDTTTTLIPAAGNLKSDTVEGIAPHDGDLASPPRNRRSTDPETPPTQALADTNEGIAPHDGDLASPPRNRRSTDPQTPPTQVLTDTKPVESSKGLRALLSSFLSRLMSKKPD